MIASTSSNLHGNSKKKEVSPDGSPDKNVFDIMQGVSIIIAVKRRHSGKEKKPLATVRHGDLWGSRESKYQALWDSNLQQLARQNVTPDAAPWRFKPSDKVLEDTYQAGFSVAELFSPNGRPAPGIVTTHDEFAISWTAAEAAEKVQRLLATNTEEEARQHFRLCSQNQWNYDNAKAALADGVWRQDIMPIAYRPFDIRYTVYNAHIAVHRRERVMRHMYGKHNLALLVTKAVRDQDYAHCLLTEKCNEVIFLSGVSASNAISLPLYLYPENDELDNSIRINFDPKLYARIAKAAGLSAELRAPDGSDGFRTASGAARPDEIKVFDYIYAVLHCPAYRKTYAEFLKTDFPRVPFPTSPEMFKTLSAQGEALRRLHLMEEAAIGATPYPFDGEGDSVVDKQQFKDGKVWINSAQYFADVPAEAWELHIGGYQPAQKWLKDRKGRVLSWDDIRHYQKIIKVLVETDRTMGAIRLPGL